MLKGNIKIRGITRFYHIDSVSEGELPVRIYTMCLKNYDSLASLHGPLYEARRSFWESGKKYKKSGEDVTDGVASKYSGTIAPNKLEWQKISGQGLLEKSYQQNGSFCILKWDAQGRLVSKTSYTRRHNWIQTAYFGQSAEDSLRPSVLLRPCVEGSGVERLDYDPAQNKYRREELFPCRVELGTAENSMINSVAGEPQLYAATDEGDFCYCTGTELQKRKEAQERIETEKGTVPAGEGREWIPRELETKFEAGEDASPEARSGFSEDDPDPGERPVRVEGFPAPQEPANPDPGELNRILNLELQPGPDEILPAGGDADSEEDPPAADETSTQEIPEPTPAPGSYPVNHEIFSVDVAPRDESDVSSASDDSDHGEAVRKQEEKPSRYVVAAKNSEGSVTGLENISGWKPPVPDQDASAAPDPQEEPAVPAYASADDPAIPSAPSAAVPAGILADPGAAVSADPAVITGANSAARESEPAIEGVLPAKSIVISAQESYLYFGNLIDGLRQGRGRTQMANGQTAYEGDYVNDKRTGFGAYYYNTGRICYVGNWKENKRDGVGVSFRPQDNSIYVGRWKEDKPVGAASVFDQNGNLIYAGRMEDGERQGVGVSYNAEDGAVFVGKWKDNIPTGEGSAFDCNGNLLYTGGWKDGRRHGMGTEYSPSGTTVFIGLWEDNRRVRGILYQNGVPTPYPPEPMASKE